MSSQSLVHACLSLMEDDKVCYRLKTPFRNDGPPVMNEPPDVIANNAPWNIDS